MSATAGAVSLFALLFALGGEAVFGEMRWLYGRLPHPRLMVGLAAGFLERRLNRPARGARNRLVRGALAVVALLAAALVVGMVVAWLVAHVPYLWLLQVLLIMSLVAQRGPYRRFAQAAGLLGEGGVIAAQEALRPITGLPPGALDGLGVAGTVRIGVLALARAFVAGVVAPCFWFALLGLPGLFLQQTALVMAARFKGATDDPAHADFGLTASWLDDAVTLLPALVAAAMIGLAAMFVPKGRPAAAFGAAWRMRRQPGGAATAAIVAALAIDEAANPVALDRARLLYAVACLINAGAIAALALLRLSA